MPQKGKEIYMIARGKNTVCHQQYQISPGKLNNQNLDAVCLNLIPKSLLLFWSVIQRLEVVNMIKHRHHYLPLLAPNILRKLPFYTLVISFSSELNLRLTNIILALN